jgi:hypothetical protein
LTRSSGYVIVVRNSRIVAWRPKFIATVHRDDAPFDYGSLAFSFANGSVETVRLNLHLPGIA